MGCCCSTQSRSALGAAIFSLLVCVPALFYSSTLYSYRYDQLDSPACMVFAIATFATGALSGVLGILETLVTRWDHHDVTLKMALAVAGFATLLSLVYTVWAPIVLSATFSVAESRSIALGTFILVAIFLLVAPLAWAAWAYFALLREVRSAGGPSSASVPLASAAAPMGSDGKLLRRRGEDIEMSLPHGRARRSGAASSRDKGRYARVGGGGGGGEGSAWESASERSGLSSEEDGEWERHRQERKRRSRA
ncbi:hypothetical protein JCM3775_007168 [Rhodotorula graminis]|uniref:Uncharacterized protein n=1 Tax=Rhodotorula graminis (strain WP1) TaxID=578459 RepID=A0A0P9F0A2_RHOGW|nr:uncharacterized protein RHOBADRAFT_46501 [Rhodotorula graminis WP1]KPV72911.1 hypothetical protein RHOBADRAFT_46501 [Rhodotorula graminis WP1]